MAVRRLGVAGRIVPLTHPSVRIAEVASGLYIRGGVLMLFDAFAELNWLAVLVAGLAYFVLGALWYTNVLFGRQYRAAVGVNPDEQGQPDPKLLVTNLVGWLVAALALGLMAVAIGAEGVVDGVVLGLVVGIGMVGAHQVVNASYEGRGTAVLKVNGPYMIIGLVVMGVILAVWR